MKGQDTVFSRIEKIRNRQLARFLDHLKKTGQFTAELEKDVKRSYRFIFEDIEAAIGQDKENNNGERNV